MKKLVSRRSNLLLPTLIAVSCTVFAQESGDASRWPSPETQSPTRVVNLREGCNFVVNDLQGGGLSTPTRSDPFGGAGVGFEGPLGTSHVLLTCTAIDAKNSFTEGTGVNEFEFQVGAKQVNGEWVPIDGRMPSCDSKLFPKNQRKNIDEDKPCFYPAEHFKAFTFKGKNWTGRGTLLDATTGEPRWRWRRFSYCLIPDANGDIALCGQLHVRYLQNPRSDVLPKVMKILKSIEFVDTASSSHRLEENSEK